MNESIIEKLKKIKNLVSQGSTPGERAAAEAAFEKLCKKYNLDDKTIDHEARKEYIFKYGSFIEFHLIGTLLYFFTGTVDHTYKVSSFLDRGSYQQRGTNAVFSLLTYEQYIEVKCAWEYFRRHMKREYKKVYTRKIKSKTKREQFNRTFISQYTIKSGLIKPEMLVQVKATKQLRDIHDSIEGGKYNRQIDSNKLIDNGEV